MTPFLFLLFAVFLVASVFCFFSKGKNAISYVSISSSLVGAFCVMMIAAEMCGSSHFTIDEGLVYIDRVSLLFMSLIAFVSVMAVLYSHGYMYYELEEGVIDQRDLKNYYTIMNLFIMVMFMTFVVRSLAVVWVGVGATTLVSTFLVGFYRNDNSTEAAWKYMMLCSVGITIALIGITLTYASTLNVIDDENSALDWPVLMQYASSLDPSLMKMATVMIIIGFGTKVGFAPMHTWLPDAHSQAPTPVSGMLSAVLLNCALYAIVRFYMISEVAVPGFAKTILLIFGVLSLGVAANFIVGSRDIKRMLAYSSIENMGLIAIGLGIGTELAVYGAMFQMVAHSVTKPLLFFSAGNIIQKYDTRDMNKIRGLKEKMPFTAFMLAAGSLIIIGVPPFAIFVGEFSIIFAAAVDCQYLVLALAIVFLAIVFAGFTRHVFPMISGHTDADITEHRNIIIALPFVLMFATTLALGLFMPDGIANMMTDVAREIGGTL